MIHQKSHLFKWKVELKNSSMIFFRLISFIFTRYSPEIISIKSNLILTINRSYSNLLFVRTQQFIHECHLGLLHNFLFISDDDNITGWWKMNLHCLIYHQNQSCCILDTLTETFPHFDFDNYRLDRSPLKLFIAVPSNLQSNAKSISLMVSTPINV